MKTVIKLLTIILLAALPMLVAAQQGYVESGNTITISSAEGWSQFITKLETEQYGYCTGKTVELAADIPTADEINKGIKGISSNCATSSGSHHGFFTGVFDGQGHTITLDLDANKQMSKFAALFEYTEDAIIRNVTVDGTVSANVSSSWNHNVYAAGFVAYATRTLEISNCTSNVTITASKKYAGGFVGYNKGQLTITNCVSNATIISSVSDDGTHGGFVATHGGSSLTIEGCAFTGKMLTTNGTTNCGGFVGWCNKAATITNSIYAPATPANGETEIKADGSSTFGRSSTATVTTTNCYYTRTLGTAQGKQMYSITAGDYVKSLGINGSATTKYDRSGITFYTNVRLKLGDTFYACQGDNVSLALDYKSRTGYTFNNYSVSAGTLSGTTLTMPGSNVTVNANYIAHFTISDDGSEYTIHDATGWNVFCDALQDNTTYNRFIGKTVKLAADINVSRMAGSDKHDFCGTFDGQGKTIDFKGNSANYALFRNAVSCTIKDLKVTGTITTDGAYAAGLISGMWGDVSIQNCCVSVIIKSGKGGDGTHGGFVAVNNNGGTLNITGCAFTGKMLTTSSTTLCAGFVGWSAGATKITNSLYAPAAIANGETEVASECTFARNPANVTLANCYYTRALGTAQGVKVVKNQNDIPANAISKKVTLADGNDYYVFISGAGAETDTYIITTTDQLDALSAYVNGGNNCEDKHFKLGGNIVYVYDDKTENNFTAIGTEGHPFKGTFDGGGYTISGIRIKASTKYQGLFGYVYGGNARIQNVTIEGSKIISSEGYVGGIVGYNYKGTISNCTSSANVTATGSNCDYNGGIVGQNYYGTLTGNLAINAEISSSYYTGAIAGGNANGTLSNNYYYHCKVNDVSNAVGCGGRYASADITDNDGAVPAKNPVKLILPECFEITNGGFGGNYVEAGTKVKFAPKFGYELTSAVTMNNTEIPAGGDGIYTVEITGQTTISAEFKTGVWKIYTARHLQGFSEMVNNGKSFEGETVTLMKPITFTEPKDKQSSFTPIGTEANPFKGTFDGGGNTLTCYLYDGGNQFCAPFSVVDGAKFSNLIVAGTIESEFKTSHDGMHGGFVGVSNGENTSFENCAFVGSLLGVNANNCGGFVGWATGKITYTNCLFAPKEITMSAENSTTFNRGNTDGAFTTCYYTQTFGTEQGVKVYKTTDDIPKNTICKKIELADGEYYYVPVVIEGLSEVYWGTGSKIFTEVKFDGKEVAENDDFTVNYKDEKGTEVSSLAVSGKYTLAITGINNYAGTVTHSFDFIYGTGEATDPYILTTTAHLNALSALVNGGNDCKGKHFRLGNTIEYDGKTENNFTAIGKDSDHSFNGTFDGCNNLGYTISGIKINASKDCQGLFGYAGSDATIKNVTIEASEIKSSRDNVGGIVGRNYGTIENCTSRAKVTATKINCNYYGGIVGYNYYGTIENCTSSATVSSEYYCGGIVGRNYNGTLTGNLAIDAEISSTQYTGAIAGKSIGTLSYNYYYNCKVNKTENAKGVGCGDDPVSADITDKDGAVYIIKNPVKLILPECFEITNGVIFGGSYVEAGKEIQFAKSFGYILNSNVTIDGNTITPADGIYTVSISKDSEIKADYTEKLEIANTDDLIAFSKSVNNGNNYGGKTIKMIADITFPVTEDGKSDFTPIGTEAHPFEGTFDGGGHTLTFHLRYGDQQKFCAPFSYVDGAKFRDLIVAGTIESEFSTPGDGAHGGFVGVSNGNTTFEKCAFVGSLLGVNANSCGGFVGWANKKIIYTNCLFAPKQITMSTEGSATFNRNAKEEDFSTCYYTQPFGTEQGVKVYKLTLLDGITTSAKAVFEYKGVSYYVSDSEIELSVNNYYVNGESASGKLKIDGDYIVSKTEVPEIKINGDGDAAVSVPELEKANVTYTRTLSAGIYTTIMLPFEFKASDFGG